MFRFMRDVEPEDPMFLMDPFAIHRQHMNRMLSGGLDIAPSSASQMAICQGPGLPAAGCRLGLSPLLECWECQAASWTCLG